jgi:hypothetical protein
MRTLVSIVVVLAAACGAKQKPPVASAPAAISTPVGQDAKSTPVGQKDEIRTDAPADHPTRAMGAQPDDNNDDDDDNAKRQ